MSAVQTRRALFGASAAVVLVGVASVSRAVENLDAKLIAACEQFAHLNNEYARLLGITDVVPSSNPPTPNIIEADIEADVVASEQRELGFWIAQTRPKSAEGMRAKAQAALVYLGGNPAPGMIQALQFAILRDLAGEV